MTAPGRTFGSTLKALFLAVLNATLILVALCLWLGWHVLSEARAITGRLTDGISLLTPVSDEIAGLRTDVATLRADLAGLPGQAVGSVALTAFADRLETLETKVSTTAKRISDLTVEPGALIDRAGDRAALQIKSGIATCVPTGA